MRIIFTGAPGVGKTTVAELLALRLGLPLIKERSRLIANAWGLTPATVPPERFMDFQWALLESQIEAERDCQDTGFISDRCVIDNVMHLIKFSQGLHISHSEIERYLERAAPQLPHYDLLIFIPPMFPLVSDGERIADPAFQLEMNALVTTVIERLDNRHCPGLARRVHTVTRLGIQERVEELVQAVEARLETMSLPGVGVPA